MIGQTQLRKRIEHLIDTGGFPRFSIFVGSKGSGKKTFVREVVIKAVTDGLYEECGTKVEEIRNLIVDAYKIHSTAVYFIPDADNMSLAARNALLKVTEEPPNNAYFIMTLEDENNTLETIRSRATIFRMDSYTPDDIVEYAHARYLPEIIKTDIPIIRDLCETPGEVNTLLNCGVQEFYDYVKLVVDNIAEVSTANAFKIPSKVALKDDAEGYDLRLFWKAFLKICFDTEKYAGVGITAKYLQKLRIKGINKQMLIDCWLLEIREEWIDS